MSDIVTALQRIATETDHANAHDPCGVKVELRLGMRGLHIQGKLERNGYVASQNHFVHWLEIERAVALYELLHIAVTRVRNAFT